jgi:hypothetical protein
VCVSSIQLVSLFASCHLYRLVSVPSTMIYAGRLEHCSDRLVYGRNSSNANGTGSSESANDIGDVDSITSSNVIFSRDVLVLAEPADVDNERDDAGDGVTACCTVLCALPVSAASFSFSFVLLLLLLLLVELGGGRDRHWLRL